MDLNECKGVLRDFNECYVIKDNLSESKDFNPNPPEGVGANMPHSFSNAYFSGTECRIDPKPGCKFELVG